MLKEYSPFILGGLLYFITAKLGMSLFSLEHTGLSLLWLPFGIGVILVERYGLRALPAIFIASFLAHFNIATDTDLIALFHRIIPSIADCLAPVLSVYLIKKYIKNDFDNVAVLLPFSLLAGVLPTFISGIIIGFNLWFAGYIPANEITSFIVMLVFSDTLGLLLLYPLYKYFDKTWPTRQEQKNLLVTFGFGVLIVLLSINYSFLVFLLYPLLLIAVFKLSLVYIMMLLLVFIVMMLSLSSQLELRFFMADTPMASILMMSSFLATLTFIITGMALLIISQQKMNQHICQIEKDNVRFALQKKHAEDMAAKERSDKEQKAQFLSMLSHELKTPLSVISMGLSQQNLSDNFRHHMTQSVQDMKMVIERCAVLETVDEALLTRVEPVDLVGLIEQMASLSVLRERIQLRLPETPVVVQTDEDWLRVILSNLFDNALKYSPADSLVSLSIEQSEQACCVRVQNAVSGDLPDAKQIFDKYYRSPSARMQTGSGLGLYIVKRLASQLQAKIEYIPIESMDKNNQQVVFRLWLTMVV